MVYTTDLLLGTDIVTQNWGPGASGRYSIAVFGSRRCTGRGSQANFDVLVGCTPKASSYLIGRGRYLSGQAMDIKNSIISNFTPVGGNIFLC